MEEWKVMKLCRVNIEIVRYYENFDVLFGFSATNLHFYWIIMKRVIDIQFVISNYKSINSWLIWQFFHWNEIYSSLDNTAASLEM